MLYTEHNTPRRYKGGIFFPLVIVLNIKYFNGQWNTKNISTPRTNVRWHQQNESQICCKNVLSFTTREEVKSKCKNEYNFPLKDLSYNKIKKRFHDDFNVKQEFKSSILKIKTNYSLFIFVGLKSPIKDRTNVLRLSAKNQKYLFSNLVWIPYYYTIFLNISNKHHINITSDKKVPQTMAMHFNGLPFYKATLWHLKLEYIMNIISNHGLAFLLFDTFIHGTDGIYKQTHY